MTVCLACCRGHASEKPELPAALAETASKITFLGPGAEAMAALGDKVGYKLLYLHALWDAVVNDLSMHYTAGKCIVCTCIA